MKKLIMLLILVMAIPVIAQEKKAEEAEKPKFEIKKFEIMKSQKTAIAFLLDRHQKELSELLNDILADLRVAYPDMPDNVVLNQKTWVFEARRG